LLNHATIIYRPRRGYRGPDRFTYIAKDSASRYPYDPVIATVFLNVGPPVVTLPQISPATFRLGSLLPNFHSRPQAGTTISFQLAENARATLTFSRCVGTTGTTNRARCARPVVAGRLALHAHAGTNTVRFEGRLSRTRSLRPGSYTITIVAVDRSGAKSNAIKVGFTLLPR
jgi:hypothetical protein